MLSLNRILSHTGQVFSMCNALLQKKWRDGWSHLHSVHLPFQQLQMCAATPTKPVRIWRAQPVQCSSMVEFLFEIASVSYFAIKTSVLRILSSVLEYFSNQFTKYSSSSFLRLNGRLKPRMDMKWPVAFWVIYLVTKILSKKSSASRYSKILSKIFRARIISVSCLYAAWGF